MYILKYGTILNAVRDKLKRIDFFKELFSCSLCLGFWSGLFISLIQNHNILIFGFYSAAICWWADYLLDWIEK